ncbi:prepilin peptidase CpaA [Loktanella ponticola]|uniref:Prepilin peptidase CpaA n=1 Tax=Yoonia ponticola TaxID=1524255 RepID=A0A7W9EY75_9RHOB|nr:prepilin peptidase CpaA [Yoonia ponticola]
MDGLTSWAAAWFLVAAIPISGFVIFSDLSRMKIPNVAVGALIASYAVLGLIALPFEQYLWHWTHFPVLLIIGIILNAAGVMGAGDAKFIAAAGPFIATADLITPMIPLFSACLIAGYFAHLLARKSPIRTAVPHWESWTSGKRFPMGFPLGMTLVFYLLIVLFTR